MISLLCILPVSIGTIIYFQCTIKLQLGNLNEFQFYDLLIGPQTIYNNDCFCFKYIRLYNYRDKRNRSFFDLRLWKYRKCTICTFSFFSCFEIIPTVCQPLICIIKKSAQSICKKLGRSRPSVDKLLLMCLLKYRRKVRSSLYRSDPGSAGTLLI